MDSKPTMLFCVLILSLASVACAPASVRPVQACPRLAPLPAHLLKSPAISPVLQDELLQPDESVTPTTRSYLHSRRLTVVPVE